MREREREMCEGGEGGKRASGAYVYMCMYPCVFVCMCVFSICTCILLFKCPY